MVHSAKRMGWALLTDARAGFIPARKAQCSGSSEKIKLSDYIHVRKVTYQPV